MEKGKPAINSYRFWSLRNATNYQVLIDFVNKIEYINSMVIEHGIEEVLALGLINEYIERVIVTQTLEIKITDKGIEILEKIKQFQLFQDEMQKIRALGTISKVRLSRANLNWKLI